MKRKTLLGLVIATLIGSLAISLPGYAIQTTDDDNKLLITGNATLWQHPDKNIFSANAGIEQTLFLLNLLGISTTFSGDLLGSLHYGKDGIIDTFAEVDGGVIFLHTFGKPYFEMDLEGGLVVKAKKLLRNMGNRYEMVLLANSTTTWLNDLGSLEAKINIENEHNLLEPKLMQTYVNTSATFTFLSGVELGIMGYCDTDETSQAGALVLFPISEDTRMNLIYGTGDLSNSYGDSTYPTDLFFAFSNSTIVAGGIHVLDNSDTLDVLAIATNDSSSSSHFLSATYKTADDHPISLGEDEDAIVIPGGSSLGLTLSHSQEEGETNIGGGLSAEIPLSDTSSLEVSGSISTTGSNRLEFTYEKKF